MAKMIQIGPAEATIRLGLIKDDEKRQIIEHSMQISEDADQADVKDIQDNSDANETPYLKFSDEEPPPILKLHSKWTWFAHTDSSASYDGSTVTLGTFDTLNDFFRFFNNVPSPAQVFTGTHQLRLPSVNGGCCVTGFAIFKDGVQPCWEDPKNEQGCDICIRGTLEEETLAEMWWTLTTSLVQEDLGDNTNGIRFAYRQDRRTHVINHKVEIWLANMSTESAELALERHLGFKVPFSITPHATAVESAAARLKSKASKPKRRQDLN